MGFQEGIIVPLHRYLALLQTDHKLIERQLDIFVICAYSVHTASNFVKTEAQITLFLMPWRPHVDINNTTVALSSDPVTIKSSTEIIIKMCVCVCVCVFILPHGIYH